MSLIADSLKKALKAKESVGPKIPQFNLIASKDKISGKISDKKVLGQAIVIGILGIIFSYLVFSGTFDKGVKVTDLSIWETLGLKSKKQLPIQIAKIPTLPKPKPVPQNTTPQPATPPVNPAKGTKTVEPFVPPQTTENLDQADKPVVDSNNIKTDTENVTQNESIEPSMEEESLDQDEPVEIKTSEEKMSGLGSGSESESEQGTISDVVPIKDLHPLEIKIRRGPKLTAKKYRKNRTSSTSSPSTSNLQGINEKIKHVVILSPMEEESLDQDEPVEIKTSEEKMSGLGSGSESESEQGTISDVVPIKDLHPLEIKIRRGPKLTAKKYRKNRTSSTSSPSTSNLQGINEKIKHVVILSPKEFLEQISGGGREKLEMANFSPEEMIPMKSLESTPPLSKTTTPEIFKDSNYYFNMGTFHQEAGDHQEALINYQKAAELDPRNPEIYNNIGLVYKKLRMYDASLEQFMRALYIDPNFSKAYNNIGVVYYKKGNIKGAISNYKKAIQAEPENLETYNNLGIIYKKQNWLEKAQSVYNKAFKIDSEHPGTNYNLGLLYEEMGNMTSAIYFYRRFIKLGGGRHPKLVTRVKNHLESISG